MEKQAVDEVDLSSALKHVGKFFSWAAMLTQQAFIFLLRKIVWFAVCMGAMQLFSYVVYKTQRPVYSTMMIAKMNVLDNAFAIGYVNELKATLSKPHLVQKAFNLPDTSLAKYIKSIDGYWGVSYFGSNGAVDLVDVEWKHTKPAAVRDSLALKRVNDHFYVKVTLADDSVQQYLTKGLVDNICSIPYLQELNKLRKVQLQERIAELNHQIKVLDSVQYYDYFVKDTKARGATPSTMGPILLLSEAEGAAPQTRRIRITEKTFFHEEIMKLHSERQHWEKDLLAHPDPVTVVQGFETNFQHESAYFRVAQRMLIFGFLIALLATLAWDNRRWLLKNSLGIE